MFKNYLKIALRNLKKNIGSLFINTMGLAVGMACCVILSIYVIEELSFDKYHKDYKRIYRIYEEIKSNAATRKYAPIAWPLSPALLENFQQVEFSARVFGWGDSFLIKNDNREFYEPFFKYADAAVFDVLSFKFIQGIPEKALIRPNTIVISERMADKYFRRIDVLGNILTIDDQDFEVTGVVEDFPRNTHLKLDFIASMKTLEGNPMFENWHGTECYTYIKLRSGVDPVAFESLMTRIGYAYVGDQWKSLGSDRFFRLQPISAIHLHSHLRYEVEPPGNLNLVLLVAGIGILVLIIACLNFINLTTARSMKREKEVGIRKVMGGYRQELMLQFWGESLLVAFLAAIISIILIIAVLPAFNTLAGTTFQINILLKNSTLLALLSIVFICGIGAGVYPAIQLSALPTVKIVQGVFHKGEKGDRVRKGLVVLQFAISIFLTIGTLIIFQQITFMKSRYLGFDREQKLILPVKGGASITKNYEIIKSEFVRSPGILGVTASSAVPGSTPSNFSIRIADVSDSKNQGMYHIYYDTEFLSEYEISLIAGRSFRRDMKTDGSDWERVGGFLINESAMKAFGWSSPEEALGKKLRTGLGGRKGYIIGVTRDFHFKGLQTMVEPLVMEYFPQRFKFITLRIHIDRMEEILAHVHRVWRTFLGDIPLESFFLDDYFNQQYRSEERLGRVAGVFTGIGLMIACLGLLGLAAFTAEIRTKEIGIRKVLGASVPGVILMLSKEYGKLVLIANLIAWPVAWFSMNAWLQNFALHSSISILPFLFSAFGSMAVAVFTVSFQSIKAALKNPVESLRHE